MQREQGGGRVQKQIFSLSLLEYFLTSSFSYVGNDEGLFFFVNSRNSSAAK